MRTPAPRSAPPPAPNAPERPETVFAQRLFLLQCAVIAAFIVIAIRVGMLHLEPDHELTQEERAHIGKVELTAARGNIYDGAGTLLATDRQVPSLWADPRAIKDLPHVALTLSVRLGMDETEVWEKLAPTDANGRARKFVWLDRWMVDWTESELQALVDACGSGVYLRHEPLRYYPEGDTAAHIIGFVNKVGEPVDGVELAFDHHLRAESGMRRSRVDAKRNLLSSLTLEYVPAREGDNLHLTIDTPIQHALEQALERQCKESEAQGAMGMIMDPYTGAVLAQAVYPAFDPNRYNEYPTDDTGPLKNRAIYDVFEPGSVFKIVAAAAALEQRIVTPETMIDCRNGFVNIKGHRIRDVHKMGVVSFREVFAESSNIGTIDVATRLGEERFYQWIRAFGFGQPTSPDYRNERIGMLSSVENWSKWSINSLPMGQEIGVTMPQLARAYAVIANGGYLVTPHVVSHTTRADGSRGYTVDTSPGPRILSPETAATMRDLSYSVVTHGTGTRAAIPEYRVGGKTGTAQVARSKEEGGGYDPKKFTAIFCGFAPLTQPRLVGIVVVREPGVRLHYGGWVAAPVFKEVMQKALVRLNVPEEPMKEAVPTGEITVGSDPDMLALEAGDPEPLPESEDAEVQSADAATPGEPGAVIEVAEGTLPDFSGLTKSEAKRLVAKLGLAWDPQGAGRVIAQHPPAGTRLDEVDLCHLEFSGPPEAPADDA